jgi:hypothetical protein
VKEYVKDIMIKHGLHKYITEDCQDRMEMLAELIVAECLEIVEDEDDGSQDTLAVRWAMHRIKKHFGVD